MPWLKIKVIHRKNFICGSVENTNLKSNSESLSKMLKRQCQHILLRYNIVKFSGW